MVGGNAVKRFLPYWRPVEEALGEASCAFADRKDTKPDLCLTGALLYKKSTHY